MNRQLKPGTFHGAGPHDCPDTCSMVYEVEGGKLTEGRGSEDLPMTRGGLCMKLKDFHDRPGGGVSTLSSWRSLNRPEGPVNSIFSAEHCGLGRAPSFSDNLVPVTRVN